MPGRGIPPAPDSPHYALAALLTRQLGAETEAARLLGYWRPLSETSVALGAVRLATSTDGSGPRPHVDAAAVEAYWQDVRLTSPPTEREALLVYGLIYQVHDDHRRNEVEPEQICNHVRQAGLAPILLRTAAPLTPAELLTARYARSHGHSAWRYCLVPMGDAQLVRAVHTDRAAPAEHVEAALTLAAGLPGTPEAVMSQLRVRSPSAVPPPRHRAQD